MLARLARGIGAADDGRMRIPILALLVLAPLVPAAPPRLVVLHEARVTSPSDPASFAEPSLALSPADSGTLVIASIMVPPAASLDTSRCSIDTSRDGGRTWARRATTAHVCWDPWLVAGTQAVHFAALAQGGQLVVTRSRDGGTTWDPPTALVRGADHETMTIAPARVPGGAREIYVLAERGMTNAERRRREGIFLARSEDDGQTWQRLPVATWTLSVNTLTVVSLSDGTIVSPFIDYARLTRAGGMQEARLEHPRVWMTTSTRGEQHSAPLLISEQCRTGGGFGTMAADTTSGPFRDRLYFICMTSSGLSVSTSADRGESWSLMTTLAAQPDPKAPAAYAAAVNRDGTLLVTWQDRNADARRECQRLMGAASTDGGQSFSAPHFVSSAPSCPGRGADTAATRRWAGGGDYGALVAAPDGTFRAAWADWRDGRMHIWHAAVRVEK